MALDGETEAELRKLPTKVAVLESKVETLIEGSRAARNAYYSLAVAVLAAAVGIILFGGGGA